MNIAKEVENRIKKIKYGKIFSYSIFDDIQNKSTLYSTINRLIKDKKIERLTRGKFFRVKTLIEKIDDKNSFSYQTTVDIKSKWDEILGQGVITGAALYNSKSLTTQNAFTVEVSQYNAKPRTVNIELETIRYKNLPVIPTKENKSIIEFIDIAYNKKNILDIIDWEYDQYMFTILKEFDIALIAKTLFKYKKKVILSVIKEIRKYDNKLAEQIINKITRKGTAK